MRQRDLALLVVAGALLFALSFALRPLDRLVGAAVVGTPGLLLAAGAMAFLGGVDFLAPLFLVLAVLLAALGRGWGALRVALVPAVTDVTTRALKLAFERARPEYAMVPVTDYSFPSGHAAGGAAIAVLVAWFAARHLRGRLFVVGALVVAGMWALAMALSRMVLGVHYLSDVVAGAGLGLVVAGGVLATTLAAEEALARRGLLRTRPPGTA